MNRRGFLSSLLGVPFVAGMVSKLDSSGKREVATFEPVAEVSVPFAQWGEVTNADGVITTTAGVTSGTVWITNGQMEQMHEDGTLSYTGVG